MTLAPNNSLGLCILCPHIPTLKSDINTKGCAKAARILWLKIEFACYYCLKCHKNQACSIILAWVNYKVAKNCLKVGKITILCSNFGQIWKSAILQAVAHQNLVKWPLVYLKSFSKKSDPARPRKDFGLVAFDMAFWPWFFWSETFFLIIYNIIVPYFEVEIALLLSNAS